MFSRTKQLATIVIVAVTVTACAGATSSPGGPDTIARPALPHYTPAEQLQALEELERCDCPMLDRMIGDLGDLRARIRAK